MGNKINNAKNNFIIWNINLITEESNQKRDSVQVWIIPIILADPITLELKSNRNQTETKSRTEWISIFLYILIYIFININNI